MSSVRIPAMKDTTNLVIPCLQNIDICTCNSVFYMWIGCAYTAYMASIPLRASFKDVRKISADLYLSVLIRVIISCWNLKNYLLPCMQDEEENVQVLFTFVLALAVFFSLTGLFGFHVYLVLSAQVTLFITVKHYCLISMSFCQ